MIRGVAVALITCAILAFGCLADAYAQQCSPACDVNGDGVSPAATDYGAFFASFNKKTGDAGFNARADLDGNGAVTSADFGLLLRFCPLK